MEGLSDAFLALEEDYVECKRTINNCVNELAQNESGSGGKQQDAAQQAQSNLVEAQRFLKLMMIEARGKSPAVRKAMQSKLNVYREEIKALERDFDRAMLMFKQSKATVGGRTSVSQHYDRAQINTNRLERYVITNDVGSGQVTDGNRSTKNLEQSRRLVAETEAIGIDVLDTLAQQREGLLNAREKVHETREFTSEARIILKRMSRRIITNRIVLWAVICILIVSICMTGLSMHHFWEKDVNQFVQALERGMSDFWNISLYFTVKYRRDALTESPCSFDSFLFQQSSVGAKHLSQYLISLVTSPNELLNLSHSTSSLGFQPAVDRYKKDVASNITYKTIGGGSGAGLQIYCRDQLLMTLGGGGGGGLSLDRHKLKFGGGGGCGIQIPIFNIAFGCGGGGGTDTDINFHVSEDGNPTLFSQASFQCHDLLRIVGGGGGGSGLQFENGSVCGDGYGFEFFTVPLSATEFAAENPKDVSSFVSPFFICAAVAAAFYKKRKSSSGYNEIQFT